MFDAISSRLDMVIDSFNDFLKPSSTYKKIKGNFQKDSTKSIDLEADYATMLIRNSNHTQTREAVPI